MELQEQIMPGQPLKYAEAEGGAADAAAREAEGGPWLLTRGLEPMDALVERDERAVVERGPVVELLELLAQHGEQRGRRLGKLARLRLARLPLGRILARGCRQCHRSPPRSFRRPRLPRDNRSSRRPRSRQQLSLQSCKSR